MHTGTSIPLVDEGTAMPAAIMTLSEKRFGCVGIRDTEGKLAGILTDGDLARNLDKNLEHLVVEDLMTKDPKTISGDALVTSALAMVEENNISALIVTDNNKTPLGIVHILDLLKLGAA